MNLHLQSHEICSVIALASSFVCHHIKCFNMSFVSFGTHIFRDNTVRLFKIGLSRSKEYFYICFNDSPSKMMKNACYFTLKALFSLKIFKFLS